VLGGFGGVFCGFASPKITIFDVFVSAEEQRLNTFFKQEIFEAVVKWNPCTDINRTKMKRYMKII